MDLATAQARLQQWLDAEPNAGRTVALGEERITYPPLADVRAQIAYWQGVVASLEASTGGARNSGIRIATWR